MRVLYIITVKGHGRGGHFHSLNHISEAVGEVLDVGICTYGNGKSLIIENNPYFLKHIRFNGLNINKLKNEWDNLINEFNPNVIHFFDLDAYNMFSILFDQNKYAIFLNKCGGPNPKKFPLVKNLILFSEENKKWFVEKSKFNRSNIAVIPNRINSEILKFSFNKPIVKQNAFCFVRIARIGTSYIKSILDSINLIKILEEKGLNIHLYIIGAIQDEKTANLLSKKIVGLPITMISDDKYTAKASDMLYLADAVIATGRGVMEATSMGKPILTPANNSDVPLLVTENNFKTFFSTNFSERNVSPNECIDSNIPSILEMIQNEKFYKEISAFSEKTFYKYFSMQSGVSKYINFYKKCSDTKIMKIKRLSDLPLKLKTWSLFILK